MPVVKGGVWTNIEDEILKASVSKYGLNQWARVSSLLARKTPKQCKARWTEWLDPGIRKIEWSKEEDEKLLHLAKLMPTQWRTIAPIVGRTATQCLDRYQKLLDEAESREQREMGLMGPDGGETQAPSADDVRRLRPGELDPDPESKPAKPDTIDLDEDQKEMLSEARARLANTQGKKAKRKARERQLEESRRLAQLQKRRELKNAGINIKIVTRKKGQMDYDTDIPFEKAPASGFYDTRDEEVRNEKQREAFDPRKQQLANKRKGDQEEMEDRKKRKNEKGGPSRAFAAAAAAGQMQKIREAEQSSKRRSLVLPAPQVDEGELENIIKMGLSGERASQLAGNSENEATRGLISNYSAIVGGTPIRTPRAPEKEDRVANEIRNARARTETSSALLGGENTPLYEGDSSTGFSGITPSKQQISTPNPMATPFRHAGAGGTLSTPIPGGRNPEATPLRTPRDNFRLNSDLNNGLVEQTPREVKIAELASKNSLHGKLAALPKPKETDWELELPDEQEEPVQAKSAEEDAAERDRREQLMREAADQAEFRRQSQVLQKGLPRPSTVNLKALHVAAASIKDPSQRAVYEEVAALVANDIFRFGIGNSKARYTQPEIEHFTTEALEQAKLEIALEISTAGSTRDREGFDKYLETFDNEEDNETDEKGFEKLQSSIISTAQKGSEVEKKLARHLGGYQQRATMFRQKITDTADEIARLRIRLETARIAQVAEEAASASRLESLREEVSFVSRREREAQELYRARKDELEGMKSMVNGNH